MPADTRVRVYVSGNKVHDLCLLAMHDGCPFDSRVEPIENYEPSEIAVIFGVFKKDIPVSFPRKRVLDGQRDAGFQTVVLDSGYVRRGTAPDSYYMVGLNGLNGRADFRNASVPGDRWAALGIDVTPWREDGEHVIVCGQVPWDASVQNVDILDWCRSACDTVRQHSSRPVIFRPHPLALDHSPPIEGAGYSVGPLEPELARAWAVVTYSSNTAVDAAIGGCPVFAHDIGSMAWQIAGHDLGEIERPGRPDRGAWLNGLAYAQWTPAEMAAGLPWHHLFR